MDKMIASVTVFQNGMVMVFDDRGEQMGDYQGPLDDVRQKILDDAPFNAEFSSGLWGKSIARITRQQFAVMK